MNYTFRRFINIIDHQLKQNSRAGVYSVPDKGRLARQNQIAMWVNFQLNHLNSINPLFWQKIVEYTVPNDTDIIELPLFYKRINGIFINKTFYQVGKYGDHHRRYVAMDDYRIKAYDGSEFLAGDVLNIDGVFKPEQLIENASTDVEREAALDANIDMPENYINLLTYGVCLDYAAREKENFPQMFYSYRELLGRFEGDVPTTNAQGRFSTKHPFGKGRIYV